jgi:hypothetical protein
MKALVVRVFVVLLIAVLAGPVPAAGEEKKAETRTDLIKRQLELSKKQYQYLLDLESKRVILPGGGEFYTWSRRWLEAELALSSKRADRISAYQAHLDRMTRGADEVKKRAKAVGDEKSTWEIEYLRIEAELWLDKAKE